MTGREIVTAALRLAGAIASGETLTSEEANDGLSALNRMLSAWSTEGLLVHTRVRDVLTLVPGTASYTMGTGATWNTARPTRLEYAFLRDETSTPAQETPLNIATLDEWSHIRAKETQGAYPTDIYAAGTYPYETLSLYPVPSVAHKVALYSQKPFTQITDLDTVISLPDGFERALIYNGALELAPEYGRAVDPLVMNTAVESKAQLKRMNLTRRTLSLDGVPGVSRGGFDINTGDY